MDILFEALAKNLGMGHFNAALLIILALIVYKGFGKLISTLETQGQQLATVCTDLQLAQQWQTMHDEEDKRRFNALEQHILDH